MIRYLGFLVTVVLLVVSLGCGALFVGGRDFPSPTKGMIEAGKTTKQGLLRLLGKPYQVGYDTGDLTWSWLYFKKTAEGELSKDLTVRFDAQGKVRSYSFRSNYPQDMQRLK
ncbi:MAG: hypothetical protein ACE5JD_04890 [Candidatus Methylomirabilia bacterium]